MAFSDPAIQFVRTSLTAAQIWYNDTDCEPPEEALDKLKTVIEWRTSGRVIVQLDEARNKVISLLLAPNVLGKQVAMAREMIQHTLRAFCPSCADYDPSYQIEADLVPETTT